MHLDGINKITIPIINSFPHGKLFFDGESPFVEAFSFDYTEIAEFQKVNDITPKPENLMGADGCLTDNDGEEYDVYAVYGYEDKVYFLTIVFSDGTYTYDYTNDKWVKWNEQN